MDCAILYKDSFTDKLEWIEESKNMKGDPLELEVFGIDGRMSMLGYYGLDQLRQGFTDDLSVRCLLPSDYQFRRFRPSDRTSRSDDSCPRTHFKII